jgi:predicted lipid-binding transport protein (Tim44 family)
MSRIVAGRFDRSNDADATLAELQRAGFRSGEYESFYVPPPGQHGNFPIGGDAHSDAGSKKAGWGAVLGALVGAVVGGLLLGTVISGDLGLVGLLLGAGLGAYIGAFAGGMLKLRDAKRSEATPEHPVEPAGGRMIAVNVDRTEMEPRAVDILRRHGARDLGRTQGEWRNGSWRDFDPRSPLGAA